MQAPTPQHEELQQVLRYRNLRTLLRRSAVQGIPIGLISIIIGIFSRNANIRNINGIVTILILIGAFCVIHGILCLIYPKSWLFFSEVLMISLVSIATCIGVIIFFSKKTDPPISSAIFIASLGLLGYFMVRGKHNWRQYTSYQHVSNNPSPELIEWVDTTAKSIRKAKRQRDPSIIDFITQSVWLAQLNPDSIFIVEKSGGEVLLLDHTRFSISRPIPNPFNKYFGDTVITLDSVQYKGRIRHEAYDAYLEWQQSLPQTPNLTWVPRA